MPSRRRSDLTPTGGARGVRRLLNAICAAALAAPPAAAAECAASFPEPLRVRVVAQPSGCAFQLQGRVFRLPRDNAELAAALRKSADPEREMHITGDLGVDYRCNRDLVELARRSGFRRIGFISEPSATQPESR